LKIANVFFKIGNSLNIFTDNNEFNFEDLFIKDDRKALESDWNKTEEDIRNIFKKSN
jgi:hypothetical protein